MSLGKLLEKKFFERFCPKNSFGYREASKTEDEEQGTDFFCDGLRFDLTEDYEGKDHMDGNFQDEVVTSYGIAKIGIRTGNNRSSFKIPVVVLGVTINSYDTTIKAVDGLSESWEEISLKSFDLTEKYYKKREKKI